MDLEVQGGLGFVSMTLEKIEVSAEASITAGWSAGYDTTFDREVSNSTGPDEDIVIFQATPYDIWDYHVESHPIPAFVGKVLTVSMPRAPRTLVVSRAYYNATVDAQQVIGPDILPSVPLSPASFPSRSLALHYPERFSDVVVGMPQTVPQGSGTQSYTEAHTHESNFALNFSFANSVSGKTCTSGICVAASVAAEAGSEGHITLAETTAETFTVGGLDAEHWSTAMYDYGPLIYRAQIKNAQGSVLQNFLVVTYFVN